MEHSWPHLNSDIGEEEKKMLQPKRARHKCLVILAAFGARPPGAVFRWAEQMILQPAH